jgi:hypothetical protein
LAGSKTPPRSLARSKDILGGIGYPDFSVITLIDAVTTPQIYEVSGAECSGTPNPYPFVDAHSVPIDPAIPRRAMPETFMPSTTRLV